MKKEFVTFHIGQCGVQSGVHFWEQLTYEHDIGPDGYSQTKYLNCDELFEPFGFFNPMRDGRYVPRTIFVDTEPTTIEEAQYGLYRSLFNPLDFFHGKEEAASNYARGRFILGADLIEPIINRIRQEVEATDNCQGFIVNHSIGGGTGSGLTVRIMEHLVNEYTKASALQFPIFPSEYLSTTVVDPYNAVLHCGFNVENSHLTVMMDNAALMGLLSRHIHIEKPTVVFINRLLAQIQSNFFAGFHYNSDPICTTLEEATTNLIPFPELHYLYVRHAPIVACRRHDYQTQNDPPEDIIKKALKPIYNTLSADKYTRSRILTTLLSFRGVGAGWQRTMASTIMQSKLNQTMNIVDWCPTGVKVAVHAIPPLKPVPESCITESPTNLTMIINGTKTVQRALQTINVQFNRLYERRCFVHWFVGEGMEEGEFTEASEAVDSVIENYKHAEMVDQEGE